MPVTAVTSIPFSVASAAAAGLIFEPAFAAGAAAGFASSLAGAAGAFDAVPWAVSSIFPSRAPT